MEIITVVLLLILMALPLFCMLFPSSKQRRIAKYLDKLPGPPKYPLIGTMKDMMGLKREEIFDHVIKRNKFYGPIFRMWVGTHPAVNLLKAEYFEKVLSSSTNITKTILYNTIKPWLGEGMLIASGPKWHRNRKLITPAFHFKILEQFVEVFDEKIGQLVDELSPMTGKQFDMYPYITNCALDVICETAMGVQINALSNRSNEYVDAIYQISELAIERLLRPWLKSDLVYYRTEPGQNYLKCLNILHGFTEKVLEDRKKSPRKIEEISEEDGLVGKKQRLAFLDLLLEASNNGTLLSDAEIRQEIDTFLFAGHDTISAMICWCLLLLGNHPDVQERARDEINSVFPEGRGLTIQDLNEMKYLERVMKETLRLYPSAPTIGRLLTEDMVIDKYLLPAGASVYLHFYDVHRDPEHYTDPDTFDPDRFLPENSRNRHPYAYVPFSAGARNCLGQKFAMYEGKTLLAHILKNYRVKAMESPETVKIYKEIVMKPQNGLQVILERI